jgi:hypothetical protein
MNPLAAIGNLIVRVPIVGTLIQKYLPTDKPWYQSATMWAGIAWAASAVVAGADIGGIDQQADKVAAVFNLAGPILMLLGVRKAATTASTAAAPPK